ncbi:MAG TPA: hypothetical protein VHO69_16085 [Phototrophicaceae bacterium]|nr:hypothetical protein [Phototrophicaceae bacterium]
MSKLARFLALFGFGLCLLALPVSAQEATPAAEPTAEVTVETTLEATAEVTTAPVVTETANPTSAETPAAESPAGLSTLLLMGGIFAILVVGGVKMREDRKNRAGKSS